MGRHQLVWAGFAREETLPWWMQKGGELVDVPAQRFAERSDSTGQFGWDGVPAGKVIRGLIDPNDGKPLLKIVTRASTQEETLKFEHPRMPLLASPLFNSEPIEVQEEKGTMVQPELF